MKNKDKNSQEEKKVKSPTIPNHWEPVPGQALVAEEIARRIEAEEREKKLRKNDD